MLKVFASGRVFGASFGTATPWVLALHGWRRTHRDFQPVLDGLDGLAIDLPGFGTTPPPPAPWGAAEYAAAVAPVLEDLAGPAVVVGHSFGGRVAVHLAARWPERIGALVLTGVPLLRLGGRVSPALAYRVARALHGRRLLGEERMERLRHRYGSDDYRAASGVMRDVLVRVVNESYERELAQLSCPVELVWGDDDSTAPLAIAEAAAALIPNATVTRCPGAGHLTPLTAPTKLREAIERHRP